MDLMKIVKRYEDANTQLAIATKDMRNAQSLAWNEGARVVAYVARAVTTGAPIDLDGMLRDSEACVTLGKRAQATEVALDLAVEEFRAASKAFMALLKTGNGGE